ncbi:hypothetical protein AB6A40_010044 [Gnathostoma spinigerum]|uniref:Uncharacterized protein n=1 Tax=Gnathostoma spinigerum TaxID=75299 RepID=A0ABD6EV01_9BILA
MSSTLFLANIRTKVTLLKQTVDAVQFPGIQALLAFPDPDIAFRSGLFAVESTIRKLSRQIDDLASIHTAWTTSTQKLRPTDRTSEAESYKNSITAPDNFLVILYMARNTLEDLHTAKLNLELRVGRSTSPVDSVPSENVPVNPNSQVLMQSSNNMINLPKLQIATFDGDQFANGHNSGQLFST